MSNSLNGHTVEYLGEGKNKYKGMFMFPCIYN